MSVEIMVGLGSLQFSDFYKPGQGAPSTGPYQLQIPQRALALVPKNVLYLFGSMFYLFFVEISHLEIILNNILMHNDTKLFAVI